ncbi:MAG: ABC transporter ATP-binding protein [Acidilobaceae archaeon]
MAGVELLNVSKRYGRTRAVEDVTLSVRSGEFFVVLGPSGCGKTTVLRLIAGLEVPDKAEIYIEGRLVNNLHPRDRDVAMVFQNYALYPHMRVYDNIAFPLRAKGEREEETRRRVKEVAEMLGIEGLLERYPRELSGGQQQRVALARALVRRPKVWLLDEPLSNLDAKLRLQMRWELKAMQRKLGVTTIYVTHDQAEAMSLADRVAVMSEGRVRQVGTAEELYKRPADPFVAGFLGSPPANLLECRLEDSLLSCKGFVIELEQSLAGELRGMGARELVIAVRPEEVAVGEGELRGKIVLTEPLGSENIATIAVGEEVLRVRTRRDIRVGEEVLLSFREILFYDKATGKLLK